LENIIETNKMQTKTQDKFKKMKIISIISSVLLGTLLHFTYKWSGNNPLIGSFSAINESVWEHLKLAFFPMLIIAAVEYYVLKNIVNNFIESKAIGIFSAISFIVIAFYTYTGILGTNFAVINILIFIVSIIIGELISYRLMKRKDERTKLSKILATGIIIFLFICFILFTHNPPEVNLFRDPLTGM